MSIRVMGTFYFNLKSRMSPLLSHYCPHYLLLVPVKRGGQALEVANAILWLLSDEASYTTAAFIDVTGGR